MLHTRKDCRGRDMKADILVIEDSRPINELICINLETAGYRAVPFYDGDEVSAHLRGEARYDLALLDVMLPGRDGFELLPELREKGIPVIFLTARGDLPSKIRGLKDGAEDYLVKPFEMLELLVRIEKVLSRYQKTEDCLRVLDVEIYPKERVVRKAGVEIPFKPMEFDCLLLLAKYKNIAISREELLNSLWGVEFEGETRTIDVHIARIRKKLDFADVIKTVPRIGYRLEDPTAKS